MPMRGFFNYYGSWIELIYFLAVVISCFWIYFKTKELYDLSSYKGIKYFRDTFLFFGIANAVKLLLKFISIIGIDRELSWLTEIVIIKAAFLVVVYASSLALIYMVYSIFWKRIESYGFDKLYYLHGLAILIAFASLFSKAAFIFLVFQSVLFVLLVVASYLSLKKKHRMGVSYLYLIYLLIFALWIVSSILEHIAFHSPGLALAGYFISIILFLAVLAKVMRRIDFR